MRNIWIYQLEKALQEQESKDLKQVISDFLSSWKSHGADVNSEARILYDRFIVIRAEEGATSGCSIDSMNREIRTMLEKRNLRALESNYIFYRDSEGQIRHLDFRNMEIAIREGVLNEETVVFDSSVHTHSDFGKWETRLGDSWLSRFYQ